MVVFDEFVVYGFKVFDKVVFKDFLVFDCLLCDCVFLVVEYGYILVFCEVRVLFDVLCVCVFVGELLCVVIDGL